MGLSRYEYTLMSFLEETHGAEEQANTFLMFHTVGDDDTFFVDSGSGDQKLVILEARRFEVLGKAGYERGDESALSVEVDVDSRTKCVGDPSPCAAGHDAGPERLHLRFTFDGSKIVAAPESRSALARLREMDADR